MEITVQQSHTQLVRSHGGVGGFTLQSGQTSIYLGGRLALTVEEVTASVIVSEMHYEDGTDRVTDMVPAEVRYSYDKTVMWWVEFLTEREAAAAASQTVVYQGGTVDAPGFTTATFARGVAKARSAGYLQMVPLRNGAVRVDTGRAGSVYTVSHTSCECKGHQNHGHCYHRAAVIFVNDVCGITVDTDMLLGFDEAGQPVTWADRQRQVRAERIARRKAVAA